jgi:hypothetical protein
LIWRKQNNEADLDKAADLALGKRSFPALF